MRKNYFLMIKSKRERIRKYLSIDIPWQLCVRKDNREYLNEKYEQASVIRKKKKSKVEVLLKAVPPPKRQTGIRITNRRDVAPIKRRKTELEEALDVPLPPIDIQKLCGKVTAGGNRYTSYDAKLQFDLLEEDYLITDLIVSQLTEMMDILLKSKELRKRSQISCGFQSKDRHGEKHYWNTPYMKPDDEIISKFKKGVEKFFAEYESSRITKLFIKKLDLPEDIVRGQGGAQSIEQYSNWVSVNVKTKINCLYTAFIIASVGSIPANLKNLVKLLKRRCKNKKNYADESDIQALATFKKTNIVLHKENKQINKIFYGKSKCNKTKPRPDVHLLHTVNHFMALVEKTPEIFHEPTLNRMKAKDSKKGTKITKRFKENTFKNNFASWDIEASPDENNMFKAYGVGFYDGTTYNSFFGLDCMERLNDYLYSKMEKYDNFVLYAHNSGKFDTLLYLSECLLKSDDKFTIDSESALGWIELNSRILNITLKTKENKKIHLRDSCCMLAGKLKDLTTDFKVKHQKLADIVDHDKITLDNYRSFEHIPIYLEHDCKGLYEVLQKFNAQVWNATTVNKFRSENYVRDIAQKVTDKKFTKCRPKWQINDKKNRLELDCYCDELKIAFEYNGMQHYKLCRFNKYNKDELKRIQEFDKNKIAICKANNVNLVVIPYTKSKEEIRDIVCKALNVDTIKEEENLGKRHGGINITDCLTGASLSKKYFFLKFYDEHNLPVFTLTDAQDAFIRSGYYGGRVEIFHLGKVKGDQFYYYDFTSLYPAMGLKPLPYGEPCYCAKVNEKDIEKFFGFIRCKVYSINKTRKPLHAYYDNGKLLFKYLKGEEIVLFSEEIKVGLREKLYRYEFLDGYTFKQGDVMKKFFEKVFEFKSEAKQQGNDALSLVWKIILNSGYGYWGLRCHDRDAVRIYKLGEAPVQELILKEKFKDETDVGKYTVVRLLNDLETTDFNVGIAAAITSYARSELWSLIDSIEKINGHVFMCDTDSIICDIDLNKYPELKKRYQIDGCGDEMGTLKNELNDKVKKAVKKTKNEAVIKAFEAVKNGKNLSFTSLILCGAKYYSIENKELDIHVGKCKGYQQKEEAPLKHEEFLEPLTQEVKQFKCGRTGMMASDNPFRINKNTVTKSISPQYSKGIVNTDGSVVPFN